VAGAIAKIGGNIVSLATFEGEDPTNSYCTLKVESVDKTSLVNAVTPLVERIVDVREQ
jgi:acetoin utilization protein AcuB